mmetsp:Transcript_18352/g.52333  ORF Transcript_18352/g.52333 Transcript_18352/m.52333 type:complete len:110 (+) Transcript_18352:1004-1333(+)
MKLQKLQRVNLRPEVPTSPTRHNDTAHSADLHTFEQPAAGDLCCRAECGAAHDCNQEPLCRPRAARLAHRTAPHPQGLRKKEFMRNMSCRIVWTWWWMRWVGGCADSLI